MKPAILYAAKSTEDVRGSIPDQLADCTRLAGERGLEVVDEFKDEAASAFHGNRGDGLVKAMLACERLSAEHGSCALIVQRSDRLARGDGKQARSLVEIVLWAIKHDVELHSVMDPEILAGGDFALVMGAIGAMKGHGESKVKSASVRKGVRRRAERGEWVGGEPSEGYARRDRHPETGKPTGPLVVVQSEAELIRRIYDEYEHGRGQRAIVRALATDGCRTRAGKTWHQSAVSRVLSSPLYVGKLPVKDDNGDWLPGNHEPIVDAKVWERVQAIRAGALKRKPGRHADGKHLFVRGALRCRCTAAMLPRKARPGVERERYVCSGRIADPDSCDQPSIPRERIDGPFLAALLDGYIDLDATRQRIEARASAALTAACEAQEQADRDAATAEARLARVRGDYQAGKIEAEDWSEQRPQLTAELDAAREAAQRAREHVQRVEQGRVPGDAEQVLLDHLATIKRAVGEGIGDAPDLPALRNVIAELFEEVQLVDDMGWPRLDRLQQHPSKSAILALTGAHPNVEGGYWLLPVLRGSAIDDVTWEPESREIPIPTGQATPSPPEQSYPPTFLARYCW